MRKPKNALAKNMAWGVMTLFVVVSLFALFRQPVEEPEQLTLSQVAQRVSAREITGIVVRENQLEIELKDGKRAVARKESEASLTESLANFGADAEALREVQITVSTPSGWQQAAAIILPTLLPLAAVGLLLWFMFRQAKGTANQAMSFGRSTIRLSGGGTKGRVGFKDVAGLEEAKEELTEVVDFLRNPKKFRDVGARVPRGVLLAGHPGTGKTLLARAVAGESKVPFFHVSASEFVEMFVGVGASRIRDAFQTARKAAPAILFIDEIDAVGRQRGAGLGGGNDEREQTLNQILVELDGFDNETQVIVLAATNRPDVLDPALLRPGRFDRRVILDLPDRKDRRAILDIHAKEKPLDKDVDLDVVASRTPGFAGADLANLMNEAAILAARGGRKKVSQADILTAVEKVLLGPERRSRAVHERDRKITAYHEGGHAIVAASIQDADPVHKVSIVSRGMAGGYTMKVPEEDRSYKSRKQFLAEIATALGGYLAEKEVFDDVTTGASNDLKEATKVARAMVTRYGMSDLGLGTFGQGQELVFLGRDLAHEKDYSEEVASRIDAEIARLLEAGRKVAESVLRTNRKALDAVAEALLEKETLERESFYDILKPFDIKPVAVEA